MVTRSLSIMSSVTRRNTCLCMLIMAVAAVAAPTLPYVEFPGPAPGQAAGTVSGSVMTLENNVIKISWSIANSHLVPTVLQDKLSNTVINLTNANAFSIKYGSGTTANGSAFTNTTSSPQAVRFAAVDPNHIKLANRLGGSSITLVLRSPANDLEVTWKAVLLDGTNYIRQEFSFKNLTAQPLPILTYYFLDQNGVNPKTIGSTAGSPVVDSSFFFGVEKPFAFNSTANKRILFWMNKNYKSTITPLAANATYLLSTVTGVAPAGQTRRAFLYYISLQRPHYYRIFRMYNGWYDAPYNYTETWLRNVVTTLGTQLKTNRGLPIHSYVCDDGWDDPNSANTWWFNSKFPNGFKNVVSLATQYGAGLGVWMAPFGGYSGCAQRIAAGKPAYGAETKIDSGSGQEWLSIAGPNYYSQYKKSLVNLMKDHGVNTVKVEMCGFDVYHSQWQDDEERVMHLADTLRLINPEFFFNFWSATYASPFWLMSAESIVRGAGGDAPNLTTSWSGTNTREQWIGGRDWRTWVNIVDLGPLYPVSSLALHGICIATQLYPGNFSNDMTSIKHEVRSYYPSANSCSELYLSTSILTTAIYDVIAEAGKWADAHVDMLEDAHWIGGNPADGVVYGRAAWNKRGGYIYVRNPRVTNQTFQFDVKRLFELPVGAPTEYTLKSPWAEDSAKAPMQVVAGTTYTLNLGPQEVIVLDATPKNNTSVSRTTGKRPVPLTLAGVSPNPFINSAAIQYRFSVQKEVRATIRNSMGKTVRILMGGTNERHGGRIIWDGRDSQNRIVSPGVYLVQLQSGASSVSTKLYKVF